MKYVIFDLKSITRNIHVEMDDIDDIYGHCECGNRVYQTEDSCSACDAAVVWHHSHIWRKLYGDSRAAARKLTIVVPSTDSGKFLCRELGIDGFRSNAEDKDWAGAESLAGVDEMKRVATYVAGKSKSLAHAMAIARKKIREAPKAQVIEEPPEKARMW